MIVDVNKELKVLLSGVLGIQWAVYDLEVLASGLKHSLLHLKFFQESGV